MRKSNVHAKENGIFLSVMKAFAVSAIAGCALICLFCFIAMKFDDPEKIAPVFAYAALAAAAFSGGFIAAKQNGEKGALCGLICGIVIAAAMILSCFAFGLSVSPAHYAVAAAAGILISVLGGKAAEGTPHRKRKARRKR